MFGIVGSDVVLSSSASNSATVTIPSSANLCVLVTGQLCYNDPIAELTASLDGHSFALRRESVGQGWYDETNGFTCSGFGTGDKTFSWTWTGGAQDEGCVFLFIFFSDADITDPVTGSAVIGYYGDLTTASFASSDTDIVIAVGAAYVDMPDLAISGQTLITDATGEYNSVASIAAYKSGSSSGVTVSGNGLVFGELIGMSIKAGSGTPVTPPSCLPILAASNF